jgi:hypothetical protein
MFLMSQEPCNGWQHALRIVEVARKSWHGPPGRMPINYQATLCQRLFERVSLGVQ